jgi:hypothetical protein
VLAKLKKVPQAAKDKAPRCTQEEIAETGLAQGE